MSGGWKIFFVGTRSYAGFASIIGIPLPKEAMRHGLLTHPKVVVSDTINRINPYYAKSDSPMERRATDAELDQVVTALCQFGDSKL